MGLVMLMKRYGIDYEMNWDDLCMRNNVGSLIALIKLKIPNCG